MISARLKTGNLVSVDFGQPVKVQNGPLLVSQFLVNDVQILAISDLQPDNLIELTLSSPLASGESWLEFIPAAAVGPQIVTLLGVPTQVLAFEVLVLDTTPVDSQVYSVLNTGLTPSVGDFVDAFGLREAIDISNPHDSNAKQPDDARILRAIEDAEATWNSELLNAPLAGQLVLQAGKRRTLLTIARYFLDSHCPRKHVVDAYLEVIRNIKATVAGTTTVGVIDPNVYTGTDDFCFEYNDPCNNCNDSCVTNYATW